jgi:hypothetical protein
MGRIKHSSYYYSQVVFFSLAPLVMFISFPDYNSLVEQELNGGWGAIFLVLHLMLYKHIGGFFTMILSYAVLVSIYFLSKRKSKAD